MRHFLAIALLLALTQFASAQVTVRTGGNIMHYGEKLSRGVSHSIGWKATFAGDYITSYYVEPFFGYFSYYDLSFASPIRAIPTGMRIGVESMQSVSVGVEIAYHIGTNDIQKSGFVNVHAFEFGLRKRTVGVNINGTFGVLGPKWFGGRGFVSPGFYFTIQ